MCAGKLKAEGRKSVFMEDFLFTTLAEWKKNKKKRKKTQMHEKPTVLSNEC
jgi:hypothetical protein